jgi:hypothetical protein
MQSAVGNQGMRRLLSRGVLQRKLAINQPGDVYEQEADRAAETVMRMPDPAATPQRVTQVGPAAGVRACSCGSSNGASGECEECKAKAMGLQRSAAGPSHSNTAPPIVHDVLRSPGQPLDAATRSFMEPRFGQDFRRVRVHSDSKAAESARAVNAMAYTVGNDIAFGPGQYALGTDSGLRILAHELTHVVQQSDADLLQRLAGPCEDIPAPHVLLMRGSVHPAVREAQRKLNLFATTEKTKEKASVRGAPLKEDCIFGPKTFEAVLDFQRQKFADPKEHDGKVGVHTWAQLDAVSGAAPTPSARTPTPPGPTPTPAKPSFPPKIQFWYHVFIPKTVSGARKASSGPFAGRMVFPGPRVPFHFNSCFETDDRSFDSTPAASSRTRVEVDLDTIRKHLKFVPNADLTFEIDCTTGASKCSASPRPSVGVALAPSFLSPSGVDEILLSTATNDPCITGSPNFAIRGKIAIDHAARTFNFVGATTLYPAFEMYADFGTGAKTVFRQPPIVDSPFALFVPGLSPRTDKVTF